MFFVLARPNSKQRASEASRRSRREAFRNLETSFEPFEGSFWSRKSATATATAAENGKGMEQRPCWNVYSLTACLQWLAFLAGFFPFFRRADRRPFPAEKWRQSLFASQFVLFRGFGRQPCEICAGCPGASAARKRDTCSKMLRDGPRFMLFHALTGFNH